MESEKRIQIALATIFIVVVCTMVILWPCGARADTLSASSANGSSTMDLTSFQNTALSASVHPGAADEVLVVATFTSQTETSAGNARYAYYRLSDGATTTNDNFSRYLSGINDQGIGSLAYIFNNAGAATTYTLQHHTSISGRGIRTLGTLLAVSLRSADGKGLNNARSTVTTEFTTSSTSYVAITGSETSAVTLPAGGDFYVASSLNSTAAGGATTGYWRLEYKQGAGGTWTALGQEVGRSMSGLSDIGIVNLCAVLQNQSAADYYFRVASKSSSGVSVGTNYVNLVAVALTSPDSPNPCFDTFSVYTTGATTSSSILSEAVSEDNIKPSSNTDVFLQAQYNSTNTSNNILATYDLYVDNSILDARNQNRFFGTGADVGSGSSVGLAEGLTADTTYTASLRHATDAGTLTTNPYLLGWALTSDTPLLVELSSFTAQGFEDHVLLEWKTASEINNAGFHLWRSEQEGGTYFQITNDLIPAEGGPTWGAEYEYEDFDVEPGLTYFYELEDIDYSGVSTFHGPVSATVGDSVIILLSPEDGASVSPVTPPTFEWESNSLVRFKLQFSTEPTFQKRVTVVPPDQKKRIVWIEKQFNTPSQKEWGRILRLDNKGKTVYWRVYGEDEAGEGYTSDVFGFSVD